ncbi:hypothetical protein [Streptomyces regalis]|uniref:Uncharacterized protein n=1 Tax=Streptomyces regalis TaxID=68262 RepID=A0A0X3VFL1_9ACTN|nr:hypothetical protein [Streptomyces regalis]KUL43490.1 hypothetical protein ADL12_07825 [Streptomyces regalis]
MALASRHPGSARLEAGRPWRVEITYARGWHALRLSSGGAAPTWDEIDRFLAESGYARTAPAPCRAPRAGDEFDVVGWSGHAPGGSLRREKDPERAGPAQDVTVALPLVEVGEIRRALDALRAHLPRPEQTARISALIAALDAVDTVTVALPAATAGALHHTLSVIGPWTEGLDDDTARVVGDLARYVGMSQPGAGPWRHVRGTLQDALREALSRPGAEGLAARDELLTVLRRFTDAHAAATAADDAEQRRLQAERAAGERAEP